MFVSLMTRQKLSQLGWKFRIHWPFTVTWHLKIFIYFWSLQFSFNGKRFHPWKTIKDTWNSSFAQKRFKSFGKMRLSEVLKIMKTMVSLSPPSVLCSIHLVVLPPPISVSNPTCKTTSKYIFFCFYWTPAPFVAFITTWHFIHLFS